MEKLIVLLEGKDMICDCLAGEQVTLKNILTKLSDHDYEIIHYSGHISYSQENESAFIELSGGHKLYTAEPCFGCFFILLNISLKFYKLLFGFARIILLYIPNNLKDTETAMSFATKELRSKKGKAYR